MKNITAVQSVVKRLYAANEDSQEQLETLLLKAGLRLRCSGTSRQICDLVLEPDEVCPRCDSLPPQLGSKFPEEWHLKSRPVHWDQTNSLIGEGGVYAVATVRDFEASRIWVITLLGHESPGDMLIAQDVDNQRAWVLDHVGLPSSEPDLWQVYRETVTGALEVVK